MLSAATAQAKSNGDTSGTRQLIVAGSRPAPPPDLTELRERVASLEADLSAAKLKLAEKKKRERAVEPKSK